MKDVVVFFNFPRGSNTSYNIFFLLIIIGASGSRVGTGPKKIKNKQHIYNSKSYQRTETCLALQPVGSASNSYAFINLRTGKRVVSHIAFPREYDDEIRALMHEFLGI